MKADEDVVAFALITPKNRFHTIFSAKMLRFQLTKSSESCGSQLQGGTSTSRALSPNSGIPCREIET